MNFKKYLEENSSFDYEEFEDEEWIEDLESEDDQFALYTDEDEELEFDESIEEDDLYDDDDLNDDDKLLCENCGELDEDCECTLSERLTKTKVIRKGKKQIKWKTDRAGYKIVKDGLRAKEVKMSPTEIRMRKKAQKKGARSRKKTSKQAVRNRARSMKRRTF